MARYPPTKTRLERKLLDAQIKMLEAQEKFLKTKRRVVIVTVLFAGFSLLLKAISTLVGL